MIEETRELIARRRQCLKYFRCVDHDDWFDRRESAAPKDISRRDRRDGWMIKFWSTWKIDLDEIPHEFADQLFVCIVNLFSLSHSREEWTRSFASCGSYGVRLQTNERSSTRSRLNTFTSLWSNISKAFEESSHFLHWNIFIRRAFLMAKCKHSV